MIKLGDFKDRIIATREIPARPEEFGEYPGKAHAVLKEALAAEGIERLYSHQADMFQRALNGENVVITTGTASGKTLGYLLPVLQGILDDPRARAMLIFPTKALAQDQLRGLLSLIGHLGSGKIQAGVYDGDTPPVERTRIRESCNLILTNPDMLNAAYLPNHGRKGFSHIFRNLRFLVLDEMHTYRGAFGSHVGNVMRRLRRVCHHYGSKPQFLCSSATIANPTQLASDIFEEPFSLVEKDGSPAAGKVVHFWQPPMNENNFRRSVVQEMSDFLPQLINGRVRTICFCRSRKETEVVLKETRDALGAVDGGHNESSLVAGYRGGYTPEERRQVERDLISGRLVGVISTNALELGIDIGGLEVVVQGGFPGTRASFWQQIGRAGRRQSKSHAFVILRMSPIDQFLALDPDWLMLKEAEHAVIDPDNLMIQLSHIRAAAAELPLTVDDVALFPDLGETVAVLVEANELRELRGVYHWCGPAHPAGDFSLRNMDGDLFKIVNRDTGMTLSEMDRPQTYHEAHPRAIYLHDGLQYMVEELDLVGQVAKVVPVEQNYYTEPDVRTAIEVLNVQEEANLPRVGTWFGDVRVIDTTIGYKMLEFHNHQNLGYEVLPERLIIELETEAAWFQLPANVLRVLGGEAQDYMKGMVHAVISCARMKTMAEGADLRGTSFHFTDEENSVTKTSIIIYDGHPGGLGFSLKAHENMSTILESAIVLVENCRCKNGCPACVGDYLLDNKLVLWSLQSLYHELPAPEGRAPRPPMPRIRVKKSVDWADLPEVWEKVVNSLPTRGESGAAFLRTVKSVRIRGDVLLLSLSSSAMALWTNDSAIKKRLQEIIAKRVRVPDGFEVSYEVVEEGKNRSMTADKKLRRRYKDLTGEAP
ncbi:MAG: DEAD/DEAH box helicase domain-containing protein [Planctomycetota bacterium]|jgi:DEAD/DEAH box helicase domain-containing protein